MLLFICIKLSIVGLLDIDLDGLLDIDIDLDGLLDIDIDLVDPLDIDLDGLLDIDLIDPLDIDLIDPLDIDLGCAFFFICVFLIIEAVKLVFFKVFVDLPPFKI